MKKIVLIIAGVFVLIGIISALAGGGGGSSTKAVDSGSSASYKPQFAGELDGNLRTSPTPKKHFAPEYTTSQSNALRAAKNYLDFMPFSRKGLIDQLSSKAGDGYSVADATFAVNHLSVDWDQEAVEAAKNYQDIMPMSRAGMIEQLSSAYGDQYTVEQATHAADVLGLH